MRSQRGQVLLYAAVVFAVTTPLWLLSGGMDLLAPGLPAAAVAVVCPALAAWMIVRAYDGPAGVAAWWAHARLDLAVFGGWRLLLAASLPIVVTLVSAIWQGGNSTSHTHGLAPIALIAFLSVSLIGAWLEELGWSAFATERLLQGWSMLPTALLVGAIWALWHLVPLIQVGRSPEWIAWWVVGTLAMRVTLVWLYARSGHLVQVPALFHAIDNFCWQGQMVLGVEFNPQIHAILMAGIAAIVIAANWWTRIRL